MSTLIEQYSGTMPESFPGNMIDVLTAKSLRWRTIQNRRSKGEIPEHCFVKVSPRKVLILRDNFLLWLGEEIRRITTIGASHICQTQQ